MTLEQLKKNLIPPVGKVDVVLDTDAYNECDDQYAIAYMVKSKEKLNVKAIYAAPFLNTNSRGFTALNHDAPISASSIPIIIGS